MQHTYPQSLILRASTVSKTSISLSSRDNQDHSLLGGLFLLYILTNFFISFFIRPKKEILPIKKKTSSFWIDELPYIIEKNLKILFFIGGLMILFRFLILLILDFNVLGFLNHPYQIAILGSFELSTGISILNDISLSLRIKKALGGLFLGFLGCSLILQVKGIIKNSLNIKFYIIPRLIVGIFSFLFLYFVI